jgi:hypothetical protein
MFEGFVYRDASITVTLSRLTAEGRSYDLATVRRASVDLARSTRWGCTAAFWAGLVAFGFLGTGDVGPAVFSIAVGIVAWRASIRPNYALRLLIHDGATHDVLHDRRRDRIEKIARLINRALGADRDDRAGPATGPASPERPSASETGGG